MSQNYFKVVNISLTPNEDPLIRRCTRVLSMVHELHKAGYQYLRIVPFIYELGTWRCPVTFAQNIRTDVNNYQMIIDYDQAPQYTSGIDDVGSYFDWPNSIGRNARELATMFLCNYPRIAERGKGQDWEYVGWFTSLLGTVEATGKLPLVIIDGGTYEGCFYPPRHPTGVYGKFMTEP